MLDSIILSRQYPNKFRVVTFGCVVNHACHSQDRMREWEPNRKGDWVRDVSEKGHFPRMCKLVGSTTVNESRSWQKKNSADIVVYQISPLNIDAHECNVYSVKSLYWMYQSLQLNATKCINIGHSSTVNTLHIRVNCKWNWLDDLFSLSVNQLCRWRWCFVFFVFSIDVKQAFSERWLQTFCTQL